MNCLAITAELKKCSAAVLYKGQVFTVNENADSSSQSAYLTDRLLKENGIKFNEIDKIITVSGPGSFTGIRVAQSLCKGLALALNIPSACISYFELLSMMFPAQKFSELIVIKSEKNQYYYRYHEKVGVCAAEDFSKIVNDDAVIIGEHTDVVQKVIPSLCLKCFECKDFRNAENLLPYAENICDPICPLYVNAQNRQ